MTIIDKIIEVNKYNRPCKYSKPVTKGGKKDEH